MINLANLLSLTSWRYEDDVNKFMVEGMIEESKYFMGITKKTF